MVGSRTFHRHGVRDQVAVFLQGRASKSESRLLQRVAAQVTDGPFDKVPTRTTLHA